MKFKKKPVPVCAEQFYDNREDMVRLCELGLGRCTVSKEKGKPVLYIETLEGVMKACEGDYIVRGVAGEFYPVKKEIFERTYEAVAE